MAVFEQTMRWYGPADSITLSQIRQAGATGVVSALHHLMPGQVWTVEEILAHKKLIEDAGMRWSVVESVPVHEDIKRQVGDFQTYLANYAQSIRNLGQCGIEVVCYNFMAVTDWTRTDLRMKMPTGALALRFDMVSLACFDVFILKRQGAEADYSPDVLRRAEAKFQGMSESDRELLVRSILLGLPGTVEDLSLDEFRRRLAWYEGWTNDQLRASLFDFLKFVIPVAEESGVKMAIHPDDPPFAIFGLPRVAGSEADLRALTDVVDSPNNGITFCTGSLGASAATDLPAMLDRLGDKVHFLHLRSVRKEEDGSFFEDDHLAGTSSMVEIVRTAIQVSDRTNRSIPMRPDHGHIIEGDDRADRSYAGYSYVGRLKGLAELRGLEVGLRASL